MLKMFSFLQYLHCSFIKIPVISTTCFLKALLHLLSPFASTDFQAQSLWRAELLQYDLKQISSNSLQACLCPKCKSAKAQYNILAFLLYRLKNIWHIRKDRKRSVTSITESQILKSTLTSRRNRNTLCWQRILCITGIYIYLTDLFNIQLKSQGSHMNVTPRPSQWRTV